MNYTAIITNKIYKKLDNYLSKKFIDEDEFIDLCLDKFGDEIKFIGKKTLEYLQKKYMIGKYSINYKKRLTALTRAKPIYNECINLYSLIFVDDINNNKLASRYITLCNKMNKILSVFNEELPNLDFKKPEEAISNYEIISDYIRMLNNRK